MEFVCPKCGRREPLTTRLAHCPCGELWELDFEPPKFDPALIDRNEWSLFRYRAFMALDDDEAWRGVSLGEGMTPVIRLGDGVLAKVDYMMPTLSFKDRGAAVLMAHCRSIGVEKVVQDSSGNAGNAVAAYAAKALYRPCEIRSDRKRTGQNGRTRPYGDAATPSVGKLNRRTDLEARFPVYYKNVYKKRPPSVRRLHNAADGGFIQALSKEIRIDCSPESLRPETVARNSRSRNRKRTFSMPDAVTRTGVFSQMKHSVPSLAPAQEFSRISASAPPIRISAISAAPMEI